MFKLNSQQVKGLYCYWFSSKNTHHQTPIYPLNNNFYLSLIILCDLELTPAIILSWRMYLTLCSGPGRQGPHNLQEFLKYCFDGLYWCLIGVTSLSETLQDSMCLMCMCCQKDIYPWVCSWAWNNDCHHKIISTCLKLKSLSFWAREGSFVLEKNCNPPDVYFFLFLICKCRIQMGLHS